MRFSLPLLLLLVSFSGSISAQQIEWLGTTDAPVQFSSPMQSWGRSIAVNESGEVFTLGVLFNSVEENTLLNYTTGNGIDFPISLSATETGSYLMKQSASGEVVWVRVWDNLPSMQRVKVTGSGEIIIGGTFQVTGDFDPGAEVFEIPHLNSPSASAFIMKLNSQGEFLWASSFQGQSGNSNNIVEFADMVVDPLDNIIFTGRFKGSVSLGGPTQSQSSFDVFVIKLNSDGELDWDKVVYGSQLNYSLQVSGVSIDDTGNPVLVGSFSGAVRFNGGDDAALLTASETDMFLTKLTGTGEFLWARNFGSMGNFSDPLSVSVDSQGNAYVTGAFRGLTDFGGLTLGNSSDGLNPPDRIFLSKHDTAGNALWAREFGRGIGWSVAVDESGNPAFCGHFEETADFDPLLGTSELTSSGMADAFVCKVNSAGHLSWVERFGDASQDFTYGIAVRDFTVYATGQLSPTNNEGGYPNNMFNVKFNPDGECAAFNAVISEVQEVEFDNSGSITVSAYGGLEPYTYSWSTDPQQNEPVAVATAPGTYTVTVVDEMGCERTLNVILSGPPAEDVGEFDLQANLGAFSLNNVCMSSGAIWLHIMNNGGDPVDGTVSIDLGPHLTYAQAIPSPSSISGSVVSWVVEDFSFSSGPFLPVVYVSAPGTVVPGTTTCIGISVSAPEGDFNPTNNSIEYCFPVLCSSDPNDKIVHPQGTGEAGFIEPNQTMTYTVRFQNTGTAPAFNIFILDTIDSNLDISTFRVVGQSHYPMITELESGNVIRFRFDNIMLPDSGSNEPESHGYVIYEIDQMPDLSSGDQMLNSAYIYFDFNDPIQTNTVVNTIAFPVSIENEIAQRELKVYPIPTDEYLQIFSMFEIKELRIVDVLGKSIKHSTHGGSKQVALDVRDLPSGVYILHVNNGVSRHHKFIKQ